MSGSKISQLRQHIEQEITAMHLLMNGPAAVSKHTLIAHKYQNLGIYHRRLAKLVGEKSAEVIVNETYYNVMEGDGPCTNIE